MYHPKHTIRDKDRNYIVENQFPSAAVDYLSSIQWKQPEDVQMPFYQSPSQIGKQSAWEIEELNNVIKTRKCNKSPGPDAVPAALIKFLDNGNRQQLLTRCNDILMNDKHPDSLNRPDIASIYKKERGPSTISKLLPSYAFSDVL